MLGGAMMPFSAGDNPRDSVGEALAACRRGLGYGWYLEDFVMVCGVGAVCRGGGEEEEEEEDMPAGNEVVMGEEDEGEDEGGFDRAKLVVPVRPLPGCGRFSRVSIRQLRGGLSEYAFNPQRRV